MLLNYVPQNAALKPHIPPLLEQCFRSGFPTGWMINGPTGMWLPPHLFKNLCLQLKLRQDLELTFPAGYSPEPPWPQPLTTMGVMQLSITRA